MRYGFIYFMAACFGVCFSAVAVTGSAPSAVTPLETVSPTLQSAAAVTDRSLSATFSEPMLAPGSTTPGSYAVSGMCTGSSLPSPTGVSGGPATFTLDWAAGEMRNGVLLTLTTSGMQDALGNPINPAANNVSLTGKGTAPVFSDLTVMPPEAAVGDTVTISFTTSETMAEDLEVTINGRPADAPYGKAEGYIFEYEVSEYDPLGMAMITISGADLAGNVGTLSNGDLLEIVEGQAGLPLWGWPGAAALLLALGIFFTTRRRHALERTNTEKMGLFPSRTSTRLNGARHRDAVSGLQKTNPTRGGNCPAFFGPVYQARKNRGLTQAKRSGDVSVPGFCPLNTARKKFGTASSAFQSLVHRLKSLRAPEAVPFFALLLACSLAFAEDPTVSNVTLTQSPNATSTQVDIYYDLVAPNGPCDITVSLSKDGGTDGYPYPVTSITGDLANVTTGTGKHIVWDLRADYPEEDLPLARIQITADDGAVLVEYYRDEDNDGWGREYSYLSGVCWDSVSAVLPEYPYTATQCGDCNDDSWYIHPGAPEICCNGEDDNCNGIDDDPEECTFTVTCLAGAGGSISGTTPQDLYNCATGSEVTAVPDTGYHFVDWSDGIATVARTDGNLTADLTVTANFAINTYTLTYLAGPNGAISGTTPQTVNHGADGTAITAVGSGSYVFNQWSDGSTQNPRKDTNVIADISVTASFALPTPPMVTYFSINSGAATMMPLGVTLNNTATNSPTEYMASESSSFTGASWAAYGTAPAFTLSFGVGERRVYFKVRNGAGESPVVSDTIFIVPNTVSVGVGTFAMGRTAAGDDATYGSASEDPQHSVTLSAYQFGKYEVTNKEYCDVLNWALAQGYLYSDSSGTAWPGSGNIYAGGTGARYLLVSFASTDCNIQYSGGVFTSKTRGGLPTGTNYSMDTHPMVRVSWYGSVAYCNWLSQWQGLTPCYNMGAANWPLVIAPPTSGGYRLPTEAEWERAAAWDGSKHWIYSFMSDTNPSGTANRCNDYNSGTYDNPLGLTTEPYTSPVGWFNGVNVSPNGSVTTVNSPSPVGAYDLSGNVWEWTHDWYSSTYYSGGSMTNPTGPATGSYRVNRGGSWTYNFNSCRSAVRYYYTPASTILSIGFRLSRS